MKHLNDMLPIKRYALLMLVVTGLFTSCKKLTLVPTDRFTDENFWQVDENVNNALNSIYSGMFSAQPFFYNESMSDNAVSRNGATLGYADAIASGNFTATLERFRNDWNGYYSRIRSCNMFLENIDKNTTLNNTLKERMKAEVRFHRAWNHFNLMNWWGDVPLVTKALTPDEAKAIKRTPRAEVLAFILKELDEAAAVLPKNTDYGNADLGRITKGAALATKARVLLYEGNRMQDVVTVCEQLINDQNANGTYSLLPVYSSIFEQTSEYSREVMLDVQYVPNDRTWQENFDMIPLSLKARQNLLAPTQELVDDYIMLNGKGIREAGSGYDENDPYKNRDPRLTATVVYDRYVWAVGDTIFIKPGTGKSDDEKIDNYTQGGAGTISGYYLKKYYDKFADAQLKSGLNLILIRYADILLMYAEAKQSLGQLDAAIWDKTIRPLRARAGFTNSAALDFPGSGDLTAIVRRERRSELAFEGRRIDDIRRWKIAETVLNGYAHGARFGDPGTDNGYIRVQQRLFNKDKNYLWPIPDSERQLNPNLTQNNLY